MGESCSAPWTVRGIDVGGDSATASGGQKDPAAYVDAIWNSKLVPAVLGSAVDARTLVSAVVQSPEEAQNRYGHRTGNGPAYFLVKGEGRVTAVDLHSRAGLIMVDLPPFDGKADVSIQAGPVIRGTAVRDATGLVRFSDFVNQLQYADVANALNDRVLKTVLGPLDVRGLAGRTVSFAGAAVAEKAAEPPVRELVPVQLTVRDRP
jgi:predicted lipoprotein